MVKAKISLMTKKDAKKAAGIYARHKGLEPKKVEKYFMRHIQLGQALVAKKGSEIAGIMTYVRRFTHSANIGQDLLVREEYRRKGIGKALLLKFISISRKEQPKHQKLVLSSTSADNKASIGLHKKAGFEIIGNIKGLHYGKDEIFFGYKL